MTEYSRIDRTRAHKSTALCTILLLMLISAGCSSQSQAIPDETMTRGEGASQETMIADEPATADDAAIADEPVDSVGGLGVPAASRIALDETGSVPPVTGWLSKTVIRRVARGNRGPLTRCYEQELKGDKTLAGQVKVKFTIAPSGSVVSVDVTESTLNNPDVEACVTENIKQWVFPEPEGGGIVIVKYPFNFSRSTESTRAEQAPSDNTFMEPATDNKLVDPETIARVVDSHANGLRACHENELKTDPKLSGAVLIKFSIAPSGEVFFPEIGRSTLNNERMESCLIDEIQSWTFPAYDGIGMSQAQYRFRFVPE